MSQITNDVLNKLKELTLIEAAKLVSQIEEIFGVNTFIGETIIMQKIINNHPAAEERITFDVFLDIITVDKRVAVLKVIRSLTNLGLKEVKQFLKTIKTCLIF